MGENGDPGFLERLNLVEQELESGHGLEQATTWVLAAAIKALSLQSVRALKTLIDILVENDLTITPETKAQLLDTLEKLVAIDEHVGELAEKTKPPGVD